MSSNKKEALPEGAKPDDLFVQRTVRETIESLVIALVLAFLFRAFEAEAFVIPTGSMAPTLQGRHKHLFCAACGYEYRVGDSEPPEKRDKEGKIIPWAIGETVPSGVCPICRYKMIVDASRDPNQISFTGDRILVNKFVYEMGDPERWDVIVFKYPGNAKMNYIKRLVGLPGETLKVCRGNIYLHTSADEPGEFHIARKPPHKVLAMLQRIDDTDRIPTALFLAKWPLRWQSWSAEAGFEDGGWKAEVTADAKSRTADCRFSTTGEAGRETWLRYRNYVPSNENNGDWENILNGWPYPAPRPELVTDFCPYNWRDGGHYKHWVSDLGLECTVEVGEVQGEKGELILDLVAGGRHHQCRIDVKTGEAVLAIERGTEPFRDEKDKPLEGSPRGSTVVIGKGTYHLRYTNVDEQLRLWVNEQLVEFSLPTTYRAPEPMIPVSTAAEPGDLAPAGIGSKGVSATVRAVRMYRDGYYIATKGDPQQSKVSSSPYYDHDLSGSGVACDPTKWQQVFSYGKGEVVLPGLGEGQYLPMGDNSPASKDGRLWNQGGEAEPYVRRDLLIGKALVIYWPHLWYAHVPGLGPWPVVPALNRIKLIR